MNQFIATQNGQPIATADERHFICDDCETVAHCAAHGCIPVSEFDLHAESTLGIFGWVLIVFLTLASCGVIALGAYLLN